MIFSDLGRKLERKELENKKTKPKTKTEVSRTSREGESFPVLYLTDKKKFNQFSSVLDVGNVAL